MMINAEKDKKNVGHAGIEYADAFANAIGNGVQRLCWKMQIAEVDGKRPCHRSSCFNNDSAEF